MQPMQVSTEELLLIIGTLYTESWKVKQLLNESAQISARGMGEAEQTSASNGTMSSGRLQSEVP